MSVRTQACGHASSEEGLEMRGNMRQISALSTGCTQPGSRPALSCKLLGNNQSPLTDEACDGSGTDPKNCLKNWEKKKGAFYINPVRYQTTC